MMIAVINTILLSAAPHGAGEPSFYDKKAAELNAANAAAAATARGRSIGAILIDTGRLSAENAERILRLQKEQGKRFGDAAIELGLRTGFGDDRLRMGGIKLFSDGSLGARTAWMMAPYRDGGSGLPIVPMAEILVAAPGASALEVERQITV